MKPEQDRVRILLTDTISLLCKNGLTYSKELRVQGLLGITLDSEEVFIVHINEKHVESLDSTVSMHADTTEDGATITANEEEPSSAHTQSHPTNQSAQKAMTPRKGHKTSSFKSSLKRTKSRDSSVSEPPVKVKREPGTEEDEDVIVLGDNKDHHIQQSSCGVSLHEQHQYAESLSFADVQSGIPGLEGKLHPASTSRHSHQDHGLDTESFNAGMKAHDETTSWDQGVHFDEQMAMESTWRSPLQSSKGGQGASSQQDDSAIQSSSETVRITSVEIISFNRCNEDWDGSC